LAIQSEFIMMGSSVVSMGRCLWDWRDRSQRTPRKGRPAALASPPFPRVSE
jgi:hypothetical protein